LKNTVIILAAIVGIVVIAGAFMAGTYNSFVRLSQEVDQQFAVVESRLQRRFDLIPNLVESVRGQMAQEQAVFGAIADARARMAGAQTINERVEASNQLESALGRLLVVMENYPQLRSQEGVNRLMDELAGTENRIAVERDNYNAAVQRYNTRIKSFPAVVLAGMFNFTERVYFRAVEGAQEAPKVTFP
jgi:LemA protein